MGATFCSRMDYPKRVIHFAAVGTLLVAASAAPWLARQRTPCHLGRSPGADSRVRPPAAWLLAASRALASEPEPDFSPRLLAGLWVVRPEA